MIKNPATELVSALAEKYLKILDELPEDVTLIAVSKSATLEQIRKLYELGQRDFGENRVQQLEKRAQELGDLKDIRWHFIGPLQSNKIMKLLQAPALQAIHSVCSLEHLKKLLQQKPSKNIKIFLQVNSSLEESKSGFASLEELEHACSFFQIETSFQLEGLMTLAYGGEQDWQQKSKDCFAKLQFWSKKLEPSCLQPLRLSMGMSRDYHLALKYGTDYVRLGRTLFQ